MFVCNVKFIKPLLFIFMEGANNFAGTKSKTNKKKRERDLENRK